MAPMDRRNTSIYPLSNTRTPLPLSWFVGRPIPGPVGLQTPPTAGLSGYRCVADAKSAIERNGAAESAEVSQTGHSAPSPTALDLHELARELADYYR